MTVEPVAHFDHAISSISASRDFVNLIVGSVIGSVRLYSTKTRSLSADPIISNTLPSSSASREDGSSFIGLGVLTPVDAGIANSTIIVSVRSSGELTISDASTGEMKCLSTLLVPEDVNTILPRSHQPHPLPNHVRHMVSFPTLPVVAFSTVSSVV